MSKKHQASRRRTYGRRQHEVHERGEQFVGVLDWIDSSDLPDLGARWSDSGWPIDPATRAALGEWLNSRGID
jgi:hypothetical protein